MAKLAVTPELVGKVVCFSYVTHQKVVSYSWILVITQAYSPLKSTSSTLAFNRHKRSWNLSISLTSDPTRSRILPWSQVFAGWSYVTRLPRMSFGTVVNRSQVLKFLSHANFCRVTQVTRGGRAHVVGRSLIGRKHHRSVGGRSQVYHSRRAEVVVLGPEFVPIDLRMACEGRELASLSWCRNRCKR